MKNNYKYYSELPSEEWIEKEYLETSKFLKSNGFFHYEISNFCKKNKESKHNSRYWLLESVGSLGPSATGFFQNTSLRYKWLGRNLDISLENLSKEEREIEEIYLALRTQKGILESQVSKSLSKKWISLGVASKSGSFLKLTTKGFLLQDSLMGDLFSEGVI